MAGIYILKKRKNTEELHLFRGIPISEKACISRNESLCEAMHKSEGIEDIFNNTPEIEARKECAKIGRAVCGNCVKSLYATYDE